MKIKQLKLQGFRGFHELTLDFNPNSPTVIIGENGVGKSSILDALAILLSHYTTPVYNPEKPTSKRLLTDEDIKHQSSHVFIEIKIQQHHQELIWSFKKYKIIYELPLLKTTQSDELTDELENFVKKTQQQLNENSQNNLPLIVCYSVSRSVLDIPLRIKSSDAFPIQSVYKECLSPTAINFRTFFDWFRTKEDLENEQIRDDNNYRDKQLEAVRMAIYALIPEFTNIRIRRSPLRMTVNKNGQELIISQLSDGEKCLLAMVGDIARRLGIANPNLVNPLEGEGIVLIDEIELHLHPQWQEKIIPQLTKTFPNVQFIITTHSPIVLSYIQPENIYLLKNTENGIIAENPQTSFGRDIVEIVENIMGISSRPSFIATKIDNLFQLIAKGELEEAKKLREEIGKEINGLDDGDLVKAGASIRRKEILNR